VNRERQTDRPRIRQSFRIKIYSRIQEFGIEASQIVLIPKYQVDQVKENEVGGHVARMGQERQGYKVLLWKERDNSEDRGIDGWDQNGS
jgi:hypothetical protein